MSDRPRYIDYIPRTKELYGSHTPYRWVQNDNAPWTPIAKPLSESRVALASSSGAYLAGQRPFHTKDDTSFREIPATAEPDDIRVSHFGYRMEDARDDANCVFPLQRLRELADEEFIGDLVDPAFTFMGGIYSARRVVDELAPTLLERLRQLRVDLLFLVPA